MTGDSEGPGSDHSRVAALPQCPTAFEAFQYHRHLFAYAEAGRVIPRRSRVLEVGSGAGFGADHLSASGLELTAVDSSRDAVRYARQRYGRVNFVLGSAGALPFRERCFDAAVSFQVVEHIREPDNYLRELSRVLATGGVALLTTPNRKLRLLPFQRPWNPFHVREYHSKQLGRALRRVFPSVEIHGVMASPDLMVMERRRVKQSLLPVLLATLRRRLAAGAQRLPRTLVEPLRGGLAAAVSRIRVRAATNRQAPHDDSTLPGVDDRAGISQRDFFLSPDLKGCLDLLAIAKRMD